MLREARFTVPNRIWDTLGPEDTLDIDGLDWELYDEDDILVDSGNTTNVAHSPSDRGERFVVQYDVDIPSTPGEYEFYLEVMGAYSYTEFIEKVDEDLDQEDHYTLKDSIDVAINRSDYTGLTDIPWELYRFNEMVDMGELTGAADTITVEFPDTSSPGLDPYSLIVGGDSVYTDHRIFHINPTILRAVGELRTYNDQHYPNCLLYTSPSPRDS